MFQRPALQTPESPFREALTGRFTGIMRWEQLDEFWKFLEEKHASDWFIYAIGEPPPGRIASPDQLRTFLHEIHALLRREHEENYCGIVYVDDMSAPAFIKIYDPHNLGVTCGFSDSPPLPGWILSKQPPEDLASHPQTGSRRRWWQRVFSG